MVCYIILHYQIEEETDVCIGRLMKIDGDHRIIVVDNCSPNGSGKRLKKKYLGCSEIDVILNDRNEGFARGNNKGCKYAEDNYDPDFYVVINNDIEVKQKSFEKLLYEIHNETNFDVLGPDIYSTRGNIHQNPKSLKRTTIEGSRRLLEKYRKRSNSRILVPLRCYFKQKAVLYRIKQIAGNIINNVDTSIPYSDVVLHGSCVVFSRQYIKHRATAFFPNTFFYYEMEILDYESQLEGYRVIYDPRIKVVHHQNVSTCFAYNNELKRVRFMNRQNYNSISHFLENYDNKQ